MRSRIRFRVLALLVLLSVITYMDRVCISVAGSRIKEDLSLDTNQWGWVLGAFILSYGLFEIPTGAWGDRYGQRRVLTRIVTWWSAFTVLTGLATTYYMLLATRFLFGMGEAGAYPNASGSIGKWFPVSERAFAQGCVWGASRVGGAITPLALVPLMAVLGWRAAFLVFGMIGIVWAITWQRWYRNHPAEHPDVTPAELERIGSGTSAGAHVDVPWGQLACSPRLWLIMAMYSCYVWGSMFYITWLPEYLMKGRGFTETQMAYFAAIPFLMGALGNLAGGVISDLLTRRWGPRIGRGLVGSCCLALSSGCLLATASVSNRYSAAAFLAAGFGIMDGMLPCAWAMCLDMGHRYAGAVTGAMNSAGQAGGLACTVLFGYLVYWYKDYNIPIFVIASMVFISAILFLLIDPSRPLVPTQADAPTEQPPCD